MCGPSSQEKFLQQQSMNFSTLLQNNYKTLFGNQLDVLNKINRSISPILAAGPSQHGMSPEELAARNTQAINAAGAGNRAAQQAARTYGAGQGGGGTSGTTSGITKQIESAIASQAASNLGNEQGKIVGQDYEMGRENYWRAQGGMEQLAAGYNPNAAQSGAIDENQASFGQASKITEENNAMGKDIAGFATSLAGSALTFGAGAAKGGFKGGLTALGSGGKSLSG